MLVLQQNVAKQNNRLLLVFTTLIGLIPMEKVQIY